MRIGRTVSVWAVWVFFAACLPGIAAESATPPPAFRPPSVPLVTHDPYFSIWSPADRLTDKDTVHWTGKRNALTGMVRIDGKPYRLMGAEPKEVPAIGQVSLIVLPTRTMYTFKTPEVRIKLTFCSPLLPDDIDILSRPVTYVTWEATAVDGKSHAVQLYYDQSAEAAVNTPDQAVVGNRETIGDLTALRMGTKAQQILAKRGDDLRIDWGYLYLAATTKQLSASTIAPAANARQGFAGDGSLPADDATMPQPVEKQWPVCAMVFDLGQVGTQSVSRHVLVAYDDLYSIVYFKKRLLPYWRRDGMDAAGLLTAAEKQYESLSTRCHDFDWALFKDLLHAGGIRYAQICALAYRQSVAANKVAADTNGMPLLFPKENFSNGCIATVDVIYPAGPHWLLLNPTLMKAMMVPVMDYASSPRWRFPFAPHDLGTYPMANGQVYGGGEQTEENQMPVEESGNMLLLLAALAQAEGNADFTNKYWPTVTRWAEYLKQKGLDPENQLCTDDFAGHLAHNVNLSAKAIVALGAYAKLCEMTGHKDEAASYQKLAKEYVGRWIEMSADGDHARLAFDKPGTWSQKYNLVWDRLLGLKLFPAKVIDKELAFYKKMQNKFGLPLDNRQPYTKLDWTIWTASLAQSNDDFRELVDPLHRFLQETPQRVPMTDWHQTKEPVMVGFQARPVIGGVFIKLLNDEAVWRKWVQAAGKAEGKDGGKWAPLALPVVPSKVLAATAQKEPVTWRYTTTKPAAAWFEAGWDDSGWKDGPAGFGTPATPGAVVRTKWDSDDIWLRRTFELADAAAKNPQFLIHHDEDAEIYINGVLAATAEGYTSEYETVELTAEGKAALRTGKNVLAVHCHQTKGGQDIDVRMVGE